MSRHVNEVVEVALYHLELVEQYAARTDVDDQLLLDAVAMRLSAGGGCQIFSAGSEWS